MANTINWKKLKTPSGTASNVPNLLKTLQGNDGSRSKALQTWLEVRQVVVRKGEWFTASAPTIKAIFDPIGTATFPEFPLFLVADILAADCHDLWLGMRGTDASPCSELQECLEIIEQEREAILRYLTSTEPGERVGAATILGATLGRGGWELPALEARFSQEEAPLVRSALICALELVDSTRWSAEISRLAHDGDSSSMVWGTATLCWLRREPNHSATQVINGLEAWLSSAVDADSCLPFLGLLPQGDPALVLGSILASQGASTRRTVLSALIDLGKKTSNDRVLLSLGRTLDLLLDRPGPGSSDKVIPTDELSEDQKLVAEGLVDTWVYPRSSWMPAAGPRRRRWLGLDQPSIFEQAAPEGLDTRKPPRPLWQVLPDLNKTREPKQLLPPLLAKVLDPSQQWWAAVEFHMHGYGPTKKVDRGALAACGGSLVVDDQILADIYAFCREALTRQRIVPGFGRGGPVVSRLLLLPLVRGSRVIPEEFYGLAWFNDAPEEREILATIPREYLLRVVLDDLDTLQSSWAFDTGQQYLALVDMFPTPELCDALVRASKSMSDSSLAEYRKMLVDKANAVPELSRALDRNPDV